MWYYMKNRERVGDVTDNDLFLLAKSGILGAGDLVWREGMPDWMPAARVPLLKDVFAQTTRDDSTPDDPLPAVPVSNSPHAMPTEVLQYSAPGMESFTVTRRALEMLRLTRPWVRFISTVLMIAAGLMILLGAFVVGRPSAPQFIGLVYVAIALLYIAPAVYLSRYATHITSVLNLRRADRLEAALEAQKSFWKFAGIVAIVIVTIYGIGAMIAIIAFVAR